MNVFLRIILSFFLTFIYLFIYCGNSKSKIYECIFVIQINDYLFKKSIHGIHINMYSTLTFLLLQLLLTLLISSSNIGRSYYFFPIKLKLFGCFYLKINLKFHN